jgi:hypothetical protein
MRIEWLRFPRAQFLQRESSTLACSACLAVQHLQETILNMDTGAIERGGLREAVCPTWLRESL